MTDEEFCTQVENAKRQLYRIALQYVHDETMAVDLVDEAVYQAYIHLKQLKKKEFFKTWITRILINECKKKLKNSNRNMELTDQILEQESTHIDYDSLALKDAIDALPQKLREVIVIRWLMDYTLEETARILKMPKTTVHSREKKALKLLKLDLS